MTEIEIPQPPLLPVIWHLSILHLEPQKRVFSRKPLRLCVCVQSGHSDDEKNLFLSLRIWERATMSALAMLWFRRRSFCNTSSSQYKSFFNCCLSILISAKISWGFSCLSICSSFSSKYRSFFNCFFSILNSARVSRSSSSTATFSAKSAAWWRILFRKWYRYLSPNAICTANIRPGLGGTAFSTM